MILIVVLLALLVLILVLCLRKKKQREDTLRRAKGSSVRQPLCIPHTSDDYQRMLIPSTLESALPTEKTDLTPQRPPSHSIYSLYHLGVLYVMLRASVSTNECVKSDLDRFWKISIFDRFWMDFDPKRNF